MPFALLTRQIFPGAHLPSTTAIVEAAHKGSSGTLIPEAFVNLGGHYVKCLQQWKSNFEANFESEIIPAIKQKDQGATAFDIEQFRKKYLVSGQLEPTRLFIILIICCSSTLTTARQDSGQRL